jgi:hypothetical protein
MENGKEINGRKEIMNDYSDTKEKIQKAVEEYLIDNIENIANRIATVWNINPENFPKLLSQCSQPSHSFSQQISCPPSSQKYYQIPPSS